MKQIYTVLYSQNKLYCVTKVYCDYMYCQVYTHVVIVLYNIHVHVSLCSQDDILLYMYTEQSKETYHFFRAIAH